MENYKIIKEYITSISDLEQIGLLSILLQELLDTDEIRYSEERNTFYWEASGDELI